MGYTENPLFSINSALLRNYSDSTENTYQYFSQKDFIEWHKKHGLESTCQDYGVYRKIHAAIKQGKPLSFRSTFVVLKQVDLYLILLAEFIHVGRL